MKLIKWVLLIIVSASFMFSAAYADDTIEYIDSTSSKCTKSGVWNNDAQTGFGNRTVLSSNGGNISWKVGEGSGYFRVMYWVTIDETAASDAELTFDSEFTKISYPIDFTQGNSGWRDIGFANCGNIGMTITVKSNSNGKIFDGAIKLEQLNDKFIPLVNFSKTNSEHFIFGLNTKNAYIDSKSSKLSKLPIKKDERIYVSKDDLIDLGYGQGINDECKLSINDVEYVDVSKFAQTSGKNIFVYDNSLVIISNQKIGFNKNTDRLKLRNIYTVLKFGNEM